MGKIISEIILKEEKITIQTYICVILLRANYNLFSGRLLTLMALFIFLLASSMWKMGHSPQRCIMLLGELSQLLSHWREMLQRQLFRASFGFVELFLMDGKSYLIQTADFCLPIVRRHSDLLPFSPAPILPSCSKDGSITIPSQCWLPNLFFLTRKRKGGEDGTRKGATE